MVRLRDMRRALQAQEFVPKIEHHEGYFSKIEYCKSQFSEDHFVFARFREGNFQLDNMLITSPLNEKVFEELILRQYFIFCPGHDCWVKLTLGKGTEIILSSRGNDQISRYNEVQKGVAFLTQTLVGDNYLVHFSPATYEKVDIILGWNIG